jgi:hypothetical protein
MAFEICKQFIEEGFKGDISEVIMQCPGAGAFAGGIIGSLIVLGIAIALLLGIGIYIYFALAWQTTAKKLKHKNSWLAWIPIVNIALILQLGGFHWAWIFLILIPILGWIALFVLLIIATWKIFNKRKYPGWFSLAIIIPEVGGILYLVSIGFLAWGKKK